MNLITNNLYSNYIPSSKKSNQSSAEFVEVSTPEVEKVLKKQSFSQLGPFMENSDYAEAYHIAFEDMLTECVNEFPAESKADINSQLESVINYCKTLVLPFRSWAKDPIVLGQRM